MFVAAIVLCGVPLFGQGTPGAAPATPAPEEDENVVILSPFEVTTDTDTGYVATQTLAGTRIRTDLRDVGSAITVVTKEFMNDIGATDSSTLLQYTTNAEVAGTRGTYAGLGNGSEVDESASLFAPGGAQRVRGLAAADNTRDFFVTDIPWDSYNVDRIDIQRGPNSILFGLGSPAGIVNASLRDASYLDGGSVEGRIGSYGSWRSSFDYNHVLIPDTLAFRFDALWDHEKFKQDPAFENDERYFGAVRFEPKLFKQPGWRTTIRAKYEHGDIDANRPRIIPPNDNISAWFRPKEISSSNPFGGMGKEAMNNPYDPWRSGTDVVAGDRRGQIQSSTANYQPYLYAPPNQQQPFWLIDGSTNQLYRAIGGYINTGARNTSGGFTGSANGLLGKRTGDQFYGVRGLQDAAKSAGLANSEYGLFRQESLTDPSVFDFYNTLIDGPNKSETEKWDAYNLDLSQTAFGDRVGIQLTYDRQKYMRSASGFFENPNYSGTPGITIDILENFQDYYLTVNDTNPDAPLMNSDGSDRITNPNFGRPYVISNAGGGGRSYRSDREYMRASLFGELRASDTSMSDFMVKLLGRQRLNGVFSNEDYTTENRTWVATANSQDWAGYWNGNAGNGSSIVDRPPQAYVYLGSSIAGLSSPAGANIPGVTGQLSIPDTNLYVMDPTWQNYNVAFDDPWTVPTNLQRVFNPTTATTQASNPANYAGWGSSFPMTLLRYNDGADLSLLRKAQMSERETTSYAVSWQGFFWNGSVIPTVGWRHDEVKGKGVTAPEMPLNRSILNLQPDVYKLPDQYPANQIFKDDSTSYGAVVHVNKLFGDDDPLPINVSLTYSKSDNFQVTDTRRDIYGNPINNPTGSTKDYGILLSTKDNKYSFRMVKYKTTVLNANSGLSDPGGIGRVIQQGLRFRNVFLYDLGVYDWGTREQPVSRNTWGGPTNAADTSLTPEQGRALEDQAITTWNNIQAWLTPKGFFNAWGFTPVALDKLTDRSTYEATLTQPDPNQPPVPSAQYMPDPATVYAYASSPPQGFTVTADTESKGYEFELTANPLPNWRVAFNASKTTAVRRNVGGALLDEFVAYLDEQLTGTPAGNMPQFGNTGLNIYSNVYGPWRANYLAMKLQEGAEAPEVRKWRYNVVTNYTFTEGFLKNVGLGASYRWQDKVVIGYPVMAGGLYDLSQPYFGPSEDAIDLWASYEHRLNDKIDWKIQLNIRNAFASEGLIPISIQPDGHSWASVRVKPVQEWFLTNTFSF